MKTCLPTSVAEGFLGNKNDILIPWEYKKFVIDFIFLLKKLRVTLIIVQRINYYVQSKSYGTV